MFHNEISNLLFQISFFTKSVLNMFLSERFAENLTNKKYKQEIVFVVYLPIFNCLVWWIKILRLYALIIIIIIII